jgi:phosphoserine phosphatase
MKPVLVFDMNETLLDMSALDPTFARIFGQQLVATHG